MKTRAKDSTPVLIFRTPSRVQKIGYTVEKNINEFSIFVADVTKKSLLRLPFVTRVLEVAKSLFSCYKEFFTVSLNIFCLAVPFANIFFIL